MRRHRYHREATVEATIDNKVKVIRLRLQNANAMCYAMRMQLVKMGPIKL